MSRGKLNQLMFYDKSIFAVIPITPCGPELLQHTQPPCIDRTDWIPSHLKALRLEFNESETPTLFEHQPGKKKFLITIRQEDLADIA